ncbi:MAG: acylneuraminate cytidylyltransferase [bacterium]
MKKKLVATLACRNQGTRLYGKPLQNLDIEKNISILQYMVDWLKTMKVVDEIGLAVSDGKDNLVFADFAKKASIAHIIGDEEDVLGRLIQCADNLKATDILRLTTESPFTYFEAIEDAWSKHVKEGCDLTCLDNVPDGSGFEIIKLDAYKYSHQHGEEKHRSEYCSLYIRENKSKFKLNYVEVPVEIKRTDIRLTVDYPEDLILCRAIYQRFKDKAPKIPLKEIIVFLDEQPRLKELVAGFVEEGIKTMYL